MKKYIIKNADGSEQNEIQNSYNSRNGASEALMEYLYEHNEDLGIGDEDYLSPFDFKIEEVDYKEVNEIITDFDSARKALGADLSLFTKRQLEDGLSLMTSINPKHIEALIALNKLFTIAQAWNKEDDFVPDFSNEEQNKWYPWFMYDKKAARFVCVRAGNAPRYAYAGIGSRLCFKTSERAEQFGKLFVDLYNKVFL